MGTLEDEPPTPLRRRRANLLLVFHISLVWVSLRVWAADMVRVEVTGSVSIPTKNVQCGRVGGTLTLYRVHNGNATIRWSPLHVFRDGINASPIGHPSKPFLIRAVRLLVRFRARSPSPRNLL